MNFHRFALIVAVLAVPCSANAFWMGSHGSCGGCNSCAPACSTCAPTCGSHGGSFGGCLGRIFSHGCSGSCGCCGGLASGADEPINHPPTVRKRPSNTPQAWLFSCAYLTILKIADAERRSCPPQRLTRSLWSNRGSSPTAVTDGSGRHQRPAQRAGAAGG